jgi:DNA-binding MarR family transcriptional regulator
MTQADQVSAAEQAAADEAAAATLAGREFATAVVVFHEAVGRLLGLSAVERKCLDLLRHTGPVTAGGIGEHTGLTTGAVTRMVDRLARAGYVERVPDPHDRRKVVIRPLPNERMDALLAAAFGPYFQDVAEVMAHYDAKEQRAIVDWTRRTAAVLTANTRRVAELESLQD